MKQVLSAAALNLLAVIAAIWLGEHMSGPSGLAFGVLVAFTLAVLSASLLWRSGRRLAVAMAIMSFTVFSLPWIVAAGESSLAFNECVADGERVREALDRYRNEHHKFPARLSELSMHLPGTLVLPPHLLKYKRTGTGYTLSFSDWLVTHEASDQRAFLARK